MIGYDMIGYGIYDHTSYSHFTLTLHTLIYLIEMMIMKRRRKRKT